MIKTVIKNQLKRVAKPLGWEPALRGAHAVMDSYPPYSEYSSTGDPANYYIHDGYQARAEPS